MTSTPSACRPSSSRTLAAVLTDRAARSQHARLDARLDHVVRLTLDSCSTARREADAARPQDRRRRRPAQRHEELDGRPARPNLVLLPADPVSHPVLVRPDLSRALLMHGHFLTAVPACSESGLRVETRSPTASSTLLVAPSTGTRPTTPAGDTTPRTVRRILSSTGLRVSSR